MGETRTAERAQRREAGDKRAGDSGGVSIRAAASWKIRRRGAGDSNETAARPVARRAGSIVGHAARRCQRGRAAATVGQIDAARRSGDRFVPEQTLADEIQEHPQLRRNVPVRRPQRPELAALGLESRQHALQASGGEMVAHQEVD